LISNFFGIGITEEIYLVEVRIWCIKIDIVLHATEKKVECDSGREGKKSIHPSFHPSINPSIHPFINPSMHPSINASIHPCMHVCMYVCIYPLILQLS
jgi:hypothetical protein